MLTEWLRRRSARKVFFCRWLVIPAYFLSYFLGNYSRGSCHNNNMTWKDDNPSQPSAALRRPPLNTRSYFPSLQVAVCLRSCGSWIFGILAWWLVYCSPAPPSAPRSAARLWCAPCPASTACSTGHPAASARLSLQGGEGEVREKEQDNVREEKRAKLKHNW